MDQIWIDSYLIRWTEKEKTQSPLCNIGNCGLHSVHSAFKTGVLTCEWQIYKIMKSICKLFDKSELLLLLWSLLLNDCMLFFTNGYVSLLMYGINKNPHTSRTFQRILLIWIKTVFCNSVIFESVPMVFNLFSRALASVPRAATINGTTHFYIPPLL